LYGLSLEARRKVLWVFLINKDVNDEYVSISIKAQPVDGEANKAIIKYLSDVFGLSKSNVVLHKGGASKNKIISIDSDIEAEAAFNILKENMI
jgi:uncharacterized protein (TIGR00251 family)